MHKKAYNFGMWYTSGTLRQNKSPETVIFQWFPGFLQLFKLNNNVLAAAVFICFIHVFIVFIIYTINEQIQNIAQKKDTLCRRMYN